MDKWGDLERCYSNYKSMLSEKYGDPKDCVENFQHDYVNVVKTEDIHPPKTGISVHFCVLSLMAMQK